VVEAIPYLVGFPPRDSVVVVCLAGSRRKVVLTARVDSADDPVRALGPAWPAAAQEGADAVLITVFDDAAVGCPLPHDEVAWNLMADAREQQLEVLDALCVGSTRYWSYLCRGQTCCPDEGRPVPSSGAVSAELVFSGHSTVSSREDLRAEVALDEVRARRLAGLLRQEGTHSVDHWPLLARITYVDEIVDADDVLSRPDRDLACAILALQHVGVRDAQLLDRGPEGDRAASRAWAALATVSPKPWRAVPLTMLAVCAHRRGDGARANVATEAALQADPSYRLARLVAEALACALPPRLLAGVLDTAARDLRATANGMPG